MTKSLDESLSFFKDKILDCIKSGKSIFVTTHIDCDGLTSGSIITKALIREGAKCTVRTSKDFSKNVIDSLKTDSRDFHIITDLGGGFANNLDEALGENWIVLDHHQIPEEEIRKSKSHKRMEIRDGRRSGNLCRGNGLPSSNVIRRKKFRSVSHCCSFSIRR